jgi:hypothetical protein
VDRILSRPVPFICTLPEVELNKRILPLLPRRNQVGEFARRAVRRSFPSGDECNRPSTLFYARLFQYLRPRGDVFRKRCQCGAGHRCPDSTSWREIVFTCEGLCRIGCLAAFLRRIAACVNQFSLTLRCLNPTALGFHPPDKPGGLLYSLNPLSPLTKFAQQCERKQVL